MGRGIIKKGRAGAHIDFSHVLGAQVHAGPPAIIIAYYVATDPRDRRPMNFGGIGQWRQPKIKTDLSQYGLVVLRGTRVYKIYSIAL